MMTFTKCFIALDCFTVFMLFMQRKPEAFASGMIFPGVLTAAWYCKERRDYRERMKKQGITID